MHSSAPHSHTVIIPALHRRVEIRIRMNRIRGPTPAALAAREQMIEMVRLNPPVTGSKRWVLAMTPG